VHFTKPVLAAMLFSAWTKRIRGAVCPCWRWVITNVGGPSIADKNAGHTKRTGI